MEKQQPCTACTSLREDHERSEDEKIDSFIGAYYPLSHKMMKVLQQYDIKTIVKHDEDSEHLYKRETASLLKSLRHIKHFPDFARLVYELFANQDGAPVTGNNQGKIDALAKEVWHLWTRQQEITDLLLAELTGESTAPEILLPLDTHYFTKGIA